MTSEGWWRALVGLVARLHQGTSYEMSGAGARARPACACAASALASSLARSPRFDVGEYVGGWLRVLTAGDWAGLSGSGAEDVRWLAGPILGRDDPWEGDVRYASSYFDTLYEVAEFLVKKGKAYVDSLSAEEIREVGDVMAVKGVGSGEEDHEEGDAGRWHDEEARPSWWPPAPERTSRVDAIMHHDIYPATVRSCFVFGAVER